ncbi:MFS transporter [Paenibacillus sp. MMS18-CY102]|uniref:MFS transporter n=1 Tax=Paenibacillus sp. MMS18-CY102 TaxID=2682849 RepID=UPI0013652E58|nr:MFS transporter [Paenibacillus sp. MMS18-CY102]MWC29580.1 MFS transporter [Paenibacillus sp. MMS18-CY102]
MSLQAVYTTKPRVVSQSRIIVIFLLGIFMGALDHGIVGPALSSILASFEVGTSWGVWSFTIYTLLFAVSIPVMGKLSDRFGRKGTFMSGIILFGIGSIIAAFAPNFGLFLLGRAVQAIGSGGIFPITAAQIAATYPPEKRGKALGWIGVSFGIGTIMGPLIGGLIISFADWQWIFLMNVPIALAILLSISRYRSEQQTAKKAIDGFGIAVLSLLIASLMLATTEKSIWLAVVAVVLLPILIMVERKQADPVLKLSYFSRGSTLLLLIASLTSGFVMASAINMLPYYAETLLDIPKGNSGLTVMPMAVASMAASLLAGYLSDRMGPKRVLLLGFIITLAGAAALATGTESLPLFELTILAMGFGVGIVIGAPLNVMILQAVGMQEMGAAVGYLSLLRSVGSTLGPTLAGQLILSNDNGFAYLYVTSAAASILSIVLISMWSSRTKLADGKVG